MTQFLPPNLLALFAARDPIPYLPPVERLSHEKRTTGYNGVGDYLPLFETGPPPPREKYETKEERMERRRREKQEQVAYKLEQEIAMWDPASNEKSTTDPFKTIFVGRVNYDTTENKMRREFESYGNIKKIVVVKDKKSGKPRGYAFVEYEHERDMHSAYKHADGKKIEGKRILVDVERGRTVKGWLPRKLGGGLGGTRRGGPEINVKISGREDPDRERFRDEKDRERRDRHRDRSTDGTASVDRVDRGRGQGQGQGDRRRSDDRIPRNPDRPDRRDRDKDKERKRRRSRSPREDEEERPKKRSRSREKKKHKDRSRERKKDKKDKDRDRDRSDRKERKVKAEKVYKEDEDGGQVRIKEEPVDDYPSYDDGYDYNNHNEYNVKEEV